MTKISRPLLFTLLAVLLLAIVVTVIASGPLTSGSGPTLMMFDENLSDSALGWAIAIPILVFVGIIVTAVLAGAALITVMALAFAAILVVLAVLLAFTPLALFVAIPVLAVYGLVKLFQRDRRQVTPAA